MAKFVTLLVIALLMCSTLTYAARPEPAFAEVTPAKTQHGVCPIYLFFTFLVLYFNFGWLLGFIYEFYSWVFCFVLFYF
jgi:hypothetical protein